MTKFDKSEKTKLSSLLLWNIRFAILEHPVLTVSSKNKEGAKRFENPRCFETWKMIKKYQGANMEEIQAKSWMVRFWISDCPILSEQIESD
jgi:hypothetical protein